MQMFKTPDQYAMDLEFCAGNDPEELLSLFIEAVKEHPLVPTVFWKEVLKEIQS